MRLRRLAAAVFSAALVLAACGDDGSAADVAAADGVQIPDVEVLAVDTGDTVNVRTLAQGQDVLFWFYAPH